MSVYWRDEDCCYAGIVEGYNPVTGEHTIVYNDGDVVNECLGGDLAPYVALLR